MTASVSGKTATAAISSLALATAALALYSSRTPSTTRTRSAAVTAADKSDEKDTETDKDAETKQKKDKRRDSEADSKRFEVRKEFFDPSTSRWKEEDEDDSSDSDSDSGSDSDDEGGEGKKKSSSSKDKKKKRRFLFVAKDRTYPKSPEYAGYEDYIAISVSSHILTSTLRAIHCLQDLDEIFEDKPDLDARDLFLARDELGKELEKAKKAAEEWSEGDDKAETKADGDVDLGGAPKKKTKERLEAEADQLGVLIDYIDSLFKPTATKLARLLQPPSSSASSSTSQPSFHPQITFPLLWALFKPRSLAIAEHSESGEKFAFKVVSTAYSLTRDGHVFTVSGTRMIWNGEKYSRVWVDEQIPKFKSLRRLTSLPVQPLSPTSPLYTDLVSRGKKYVELTEGGGMRFLRYEGVMVQVLGVGMDRRVVKMRADGRAVVDVKSYRRMNPTRAMNQWWESDDDDDDPFLYGDPSHPLAPSSDDESTSPQSVSTSDLVLLPPTIYGFSLSLREWGELLVANFSPIAFRDNAWDRLVLDEQTKRLVKGLVECNEAVREARKRQKKEGAGATTNGQAAKEEKEVEVVSDIVEGKGGGLVITLHGAPGTGKTLTAEAVAETLRVPLYTVGAGSLGVQADVLEKRLRDVLDIAQYWGAALLIDEADVFLEARSLHDVARNAMVSVFLRLLEHHRGVLFLTTNRIRSIDPAFLSRFSLAITYPNLDREKRKVIWRQFLELARVGIDSDDSAFPSPAATPSRGSPEPNGTPALRFDSHISPSYLSKLASNTSFNGRQIKNAVRTAQALALSQGEKLGQKQIEEVVKAVEDFKRDFEEADEAGVYEAPGEGWKDSTNIFN
ncbi:hypothetical protein NBRC10513v2_001392 [Rhodotorula toruloides]|uniref:BY PROTMAP: gi/472580465/gb/EMS18265.1/ AAA family ATPase [Rhodosporidium toruloides NP11] gi/647395116/emb/CDR36309.1/ RHTO0S02e00122g1_1 [Rhodosporidium toruloides] n=1 Tax=Rhodotorula toruloides TaxID=5286 RepID=A0A0K3CRX6_RHOTO